MNVSQKKIANSINYVSVSEAEIVVNVPQNSCLTEWDSLTTSTSFKKCMILRRYI